MGKRKVLTKIVAVLLTVVLAGEILSSSVYASAFENATSNGKKSENIHEQGYGNYYHTVQSYLYRNADGSYNRVEYINGYIYSEMYSSDFKYISRKKIQLELPVFGGVYASQDAYFVVEGQNNTKAKPGVTEFRIIKYDKQWNRLASGDIKDANTTVPFRAGSCRFVQNGDMLYIRTCHEMYNGHQASVMIQMNMSDCSIITADSDVANSSYGYISHSFNQYLAQKNGVIYACDHGDAYTRGITMMRFDCLEPGTEYFNNEVTSVVSMPFTGKTGDNYTGATLGGFAVSDTHAIAVGSSVPQVKSSEDYEVYNIFVTAVATGNFTKQSAVTSWITNYSQKGKRTASNPQMVEINSNNYLLLWEEYYKNEFNRMCYVFIDGTGNKISPVRSLYAPLSDCQPILSGNDVVWYVTENNSPVFYRLSVNGDSVSPEKKNTRFTKDGIVYKVTKSSSKSCEVAVVGYKKSKMSSEVFLPKKVMYNGYVYSVTKISAKAFRNCKKLKSISIPSTVTSIGKQAFAGCKNLKILQVASQKYTSKKIGKQAFKGISKRVSVVVPNKKMKAYKKLFAQKGLNKRAKFYKQSAVWY